MSLWGSIDQSNNAPKYAIIDNSPNTGIQLYGSRVVGLDDGEAKNSAHCAHAGWVQVMYGTGPVSNVTITAAGTGYANGEVVNISGGTTNAVFTVATNGAGGITGLTTVNVGAGFKNVATTTTAVQQTAGGTASAGSGATFTVTLGGRANRIQMNTLVALSNMTANGSTAAG